MSNYQDHAKLRTVGLHVLFWVIYLLLWAARDLAFHDNYMDNLRTNATTGWHYVPFIYFNLFYLVPKLLLKGRYTQYLLAIVPGILLVTYISYHLHYWLFSSRLEGTIEVAMFFRSWEGLAVILTEVLILFALAMTLYLLQQWYQKERYAKELEKQKLEAELNLLKSQVNPHFLFNSLNSIFVMMEKDRTKSKSMLVQLSDVLSHQLYETQKRSVPLQLEVDNLKNYIELERTRHGDLANVQVDIQENLNGHQIAPMLLLPIVENAFKHSKSNSDYWINIGLGLEAHHLSFQVENSQGQNRNHKGGLGLANLRRQLGLLYPNKHHLRIDQNQNAFAIDLKIELDDHPLSYS
ncbi:MAG: histidine kinase [Saprospiraceae bacterium]|nr:histidine kinase [Saprospiraceae bacterium]